MARKSFKSKSEKIIAPHLQRSLFVMISGVLCIVIALYWQPLPGVIWQVPEGSIWSYVLYGGFFLGIVVLLFSSFIINHFELFGLQQTFLHMRNKHAKASSFKEILLYKFVRHPLYLGFAMILWIRPEMTTTQLMLSLGLMAYTFLGIYFEERDLIQEFGQKYLEYKQRVPSIIPFTKWN